MADFNKGDFTQQGVDGHVRATLRLNEKRYVELDLTTNENARGCTISGNVHDRLNNLDYPIGAAKIISSKTITENGTYNASADDCDGYNPVTVNVQSGMQPTSQTQYTLNNYSYTCEYDMEYEEYSYIANALPFVMNIKTGAVNYIYDNTEGTTTCSVSSDGKISIGDGALTSVPFYVNIDVVSGTMYIYGVDENAHHLTISFTATGYPVMINTQTSEDSPYNMYLNNDINQTYYLYLDPYGDGTGSRGGIIYTGLTNNVPSITIVKFSGTPK